MTIENYDKILEWVNSIRAIYGAPALTELAKGQACNGNHCPLANSLVSEENGAYQVDMAYHTFTIYMSYDLAHSSELAESHKEELEDGKFLYRLIGPVPDFIRDFLIQVDSNEYPDLAESHIDVEDSYDEDHWDYTNQENEMRYEQTLISNREWIIIEEDEEYTEEDFLDDDWEDRGYDYWYWVEDDLESDPF